MKKGFTLIEMIGVMVILSLLMMFVMPNIINYIKKGGDTKDTVLKTMIYEATQKYIDDNKTRFKQDKNNIYCISVYTLAQEGYVESPIVLSSSDEDITEETSTKSVKVTYNKKYNYELTDECTGIINPTPVLTEGLTPVIYDAANEKWIVVDKNDPKWYDYDEQKWANAVVLGTDVTKQIGDEVKVDGTEAKMMLVYIPRFEYKIEGTYGKHTDGTDGTAELPGEIKVNFVLRIKKGYDEKSGYRVHPAFTFGEQELSGFWVGKFEISSVGTNLTSNNNLGCSKTSCTNAQYLRVLPSKPSLRSNNVSNFWYGIKSIENTSSFGLSNMDTHMMKNNEWGAVAYLSQSKYGKYGNNDYEGVQKEVYQNKDEGYVTGKSNGTPSQSTSYTQCSYNQKKGTDTNQDQNNCGPGASTTGNIYGVYDMSGGSWEYVMGAYEDSQGIYSGYSASYNSGFNGRTGIDNGNVTNGVQVPDSKYYDIYANSTNSETNDGSLSCNNGICYGHAMSETASWYGDYSNMVSSNYPWFVRGGYCYGLTGAGIFGHSRVSGGSDSSYSARVVGFGK